MANADNELPEVISAYKEIGETPLQAIERLRAENNIGADTPITYAGRLDPMAEGLLILLAGESVHKKEDFLKLDKEYEFTVLFGFSTDTYDLLGRIDDTKDETLDVKQLEKLLSKFIAVQEQKYPPYSSKTVDGQPLFVWAREGRLHEIEIPSHEIEIKSLDLLETKSISKVELKEYLLENLAKVKGDFRVKETLELWNAYIDCSIRESYELASLKMRCTSGTYVRAFVHEIGELIKIPATTYSIKRTKVGKYKI